MGRIIIIGLLIGVAYLYVKQRNETIERARKLDAEIAAKKKGAEAS